MSDKLKSTNLTIAERQNTEARPKPIIVRIVQKDPKSSVLIGGVAAKHGQLAMVAEHEAADLVARGRAELVSK